MPTRDQRPTADLDTERLLKETASNLQSLVNDSATLEELSDAHRLMPSPSDLSRQANGSHRTQCGYWKRVLAQMLAMKRCGADRSELEAVFEELRWFIAALYSDEVEDLRGATVEAAEMDAEEDRAFASLLSDGEVTPEESRRYARRLRSEVAHKRRSLVRHRQHARQGRLS